MAQTCRGLSACRFKGGVRLRLDRTVTYPWRSLRGHHGQGENGHGVAWLFRRGIYSELLGAFSLNCGLTFTM
jgi:hypothetical protein